MIRIRSIRTKFLLPIFVILIVSFGGGIVALIQSVEGLMANQMETTQQLNLAGIEANAEAKRTDIYGNIDRMGHKALELAAMAASAPGVEAAYALALSGNPADEADAAAQAGRDRLRQLFRPLLTAYQRTTGLDNLQLHFHLPTARSLVRLWRDGWQTERDGRKIDISDDLSGFRQAVVQINQPPHAPIRGIEVGRGGFAIRGIAPVQDGAGQHLGSVETLLPFEALLSISRTADSQYYGVYMTSELLSVATGLKDQSRYPQVDGAFVLCAGTDRELLQREVDGALLRQGLQQPVSQLRERVHLSAFPLLDYSGARVGVMVMVQDIGPQLATLTQMVNTAKQALVAMEWRAALGSLLVLGLIATVVLVLVSYVTRPLIRAAAAAQAVAAGDLSQRLRLQRDDEIGDLALALDRMSDSLSDKVTLAGKIADGDLSVSVPLASPQDRFGQALQHMVAQLGNLIGEVHGASRQIVTGANQVSDVSQALSQGATEQAASVEQISSSMTQIAGQTRRNADNARQARQLSQQATSAAVEGERNMSQMMTAMEAINAAGQNISKIIKVIDEIAFQTNLLALNAAVEAARAGQHGKGFAVVAEEVRNLAARSAKAAQETASLIEGSVNKAEQGMHTSRLTAESLGQIDGHIKAMAELIGEIANAADEQAEGIGQVNIGLSQIDQVTQKNTASAEEGAAAAEELSSQAEHLLGMLQRFRTRSDESRKQLSPLSPVRPALPAAGDEDLWGV